MNPAEEQRLRELLGAPNGAPLPMPPPRQRIEESWHGIEGIGFDEWIAPNGTRMTRMLIQHPDRVLFVPMSLVHLEQLGRAALDTAQKIRGKQNGD